MLNFYGMTAANALESSTALLTKSFSDFYLDGHLVAPPGFLDNDLVFPALCRRDFPRTRGAGRAVLAVFLAGLVVDAQVHVVFLRAGRRALDLLPRREGQEV